MSDKLEMTVGIGDGSFDECGVPDDPEFYRGFTLEQFKNASKEELAEAAKHNDFLLKKDDSCE